MLRDIRIETKNNESHQIARRRFCTFEGVRKCYSTKHIGRELFFQQIIFSNFGRMSCVNFNNLP